jgi:hypothetical protein
MDTLRLSTRTLSEVCNIGSILACYAGIPLPLVAGLNATGSALRATDILQNVSSCVSGDISKCFNVLDMPFAIRRIEDVVYSVAAYRLDDLGYLAAGMSAPAQARESGRNGDRQLLSL